MSKSKQNKRSKARRSGASRTSNSKRSSSSNRSGLSLAPRLTLSQDRRRDIVGLLIIGLGVFTLLGVFSIQGGALSDAWQLLLGRVFGWGKLAIPFLLMGIGLLLILRNFGDRFPQLEAEKIIGSGVLLVCTLTILHGLLGPADLTQAMEFARQSRGGGLIGASLYSLLLGAFGGLGAFVVLTGILLVGVILVAGLSIPEFVELFRSAIDVFRSWLKERLPEKEPSARSRRGISLIGGSEADFKVREAVADSTQAGQNADAVRVTDPSQPAIALGIKESAHVEWMLPQIDDILERGIAGKADDEFDQQRARLIEDTLAMFGAPARIVEINRGPTITQFGVEPDFIDMRGGRRTKVKVSKIAALVDDLALALAAPSIRIEAPVPGKGYVGIEVPNPEISLVSLRDVMEAVNFQRLSSYLRLGLGQDVSGHAVAADLTTMPHLLVAGTTGSGKSVCVNAIVACFLLQNTPQNLRLVMIDPKRVELTYYNGVPHLLAPVVVDLERVVPALQWVSREMDQRYRTFSKQGVRNINDYNDRMQAIGQEGMHYIVVVIDELADLMMMAPDETERVITRLAQLARATGIHLVIATQRPSVDVVTGLIKANFPARIAFAVASSVDSRVIIDQPGAERLLGKGDMLFQAPDAAAPLRMQGSFVSEQELGRLIRFWKNQALGGEMTQPTPVAEPESIPTGSSLEQGSLWENPDLEIEERDELYDQSVAIVREMRRASITLLQRRLRIGYTRAARLIDQLEEAGIVGPARGGSLPREVLDYGDLLPVTED